MNWTAALRANLTKEGVILFASLYLCIEGEVGKTLVCYVIYHIPRLLEVQEWSIDIDMCNGATITVTIKEGSDTDSFLHGCLDTKRNELVTIQRKVSNYGVGMK